MASAWASPTHERSTAERDRRTAPEVDHRPLRDGPPEIDARGVAQREVTRGEHAAVVADPRGDRIVGILCRTPVEFDRHARKHPRMVVDTEGIDPEALAVGVGPGRIEDGRAQRRNRRPQREIHILRLDPEIVTRFFCHVRFVFNPGTMSGNLDKDTNFSRIFRILPSESKNRIQGRYNSDMKVFFRSIYRFSINIICFSKILTYICMTGIQVEPRCRTKKHCSIGFW